MRVLPIIACGILWTGLGAAEPPSSASPAPHREADAGDQDAVTAALALIDQSDLEKQMMAAGIMAADAAMESQMESFRRDGVELPPALADKVRALVLRETDAMVRDMAKTARADAALIYARFFTAAELRQIKELQANPVMQKMQALSPQLSVELSKIGMSKAAEHEPVLQRKVQDLVDDWMSGQAAAAESTS